MITSKQVDAANRIASQEKNAAALVDKIEIPRDILPSEKQPEGAYNVLFKLVKKKRKHWLDNFSSPVPNPNKNNTPERMCLLAGSTSVWESDNENIIKDKERYRRARVGMDILFEDGVCRVASTDVLKLEFLRRHPRNVGDRRVGTIGSDFYEYSPKREAEERHKKQLLKIEMVVKAKEMPIDYAKKLASFMGIPFVDELGMPKEDDGIRTELMLKADTDPVTFQKYLDSREVEVSYKVKRAIIDAKIDLGGATGNAMWASGKGFIAKIPSTRKPYEYLTELAMTNSEEGRKFKEQLESIIT